MGIYIFNTDVLLPALIKDAEDPNSKHDFGHNILPGMLGKYKMMRTTSSMRISKDALYWRDVGTLDAYYDANMDVVAVSPVFNLYDRGMADAHAAAAVSAGEVCVRRAGTYGHGDQLGRFAGCVISGAVVRNSVLSQDVRVNSYAEVDASIIFTHVNIGRHCRIRRAIIDRDVHLPEGTVIGYDPVEDKRNYFVTPTGLTVVTRDYSLYENPVAADFMGTAFDGEQGVSR